MWSVSNKSDLPIVVYFTIIVFIYDVKLTKIKINWNLEYLWFRYMYLLKKMHNWGDFNSSNNVCNREWLTGCRGGLIINVTQCQLEHSDSVFCTNPYLCPLYQSQFSSTLELGKNTNLCSGLSDRHLHILNLRDWEHSIAILVKKFCLSLLKLEYLCPSPI